MEELYLLLADRVSNIEELNLRLSSPSKQFSAINPEPKTSSIKSSETQEFNKLLNQMKRSEKVRVIKEDDLIDIVFNLKAFDTSQRQRFQDKSYEIMKQIRKDFSYKKPKGSNDTKDIASLYLNFFFFTSMKNKVEDLKRVYVDNKIRGLPIVSVLVKWLVELTREHFRNIIKEATQEYELNITALSQRREKSPVKLTSPKTGRFLTSQKSTKVGGEYNDDKQNIDTQDMNEKNQNSQTEIADSRIDKYREIMKDSGLSLDNLPSAYIQMQRQSPYNLVSPGSSVPKYLANSSLIQKKKNPIIQVYLIITGYPTLQLDPIEDLDISCVAMLNQWVGIQRDTKRLKGKNLITVDTDKKREAIVQAYKNLYSRNFEVERTISNFQSKSFQRGNVDYNPQETTKKDAFLEDYTIDYFEQYYQVLIPNPTVPATNDSSPKHQAIDRKKKVPTSLIAQHNTPYATRRPSTSNALRGSRSNGTISPILNIPTNLFKDYPEASASQDHTRRKVEVPIARENPERILKLENAMRIESIQKVESTPKSESPSRIDNAVKVETLGELYSENYFRILKVANFLQKVPSAPLKKEKEVKEVSKIKIAGEHSPVTPSISNMLEKLYTTSSKTAPSEESFSPKHYRGVVSIEPYLKKPTSIDDESLCEKNSSISIQKARSFHTNSHAENLKRFSLTKDSKEGRSVQSLHGIKVAKFKEFLIGKDPSKDRITLVDQDNTSKAYNFQRKSSSEVEENLKKRFVKQSSDAAIKNNFFLCFDYDGKEDLDSKKRKESFMDCSKEERADSKKQSRRIKIVNPTSLTSKNL